jgi:hypothetical protein
VSARRGCLRQSASRPPRMAVRTAI